MRNVDRLDFLFEKVFVSRLENEASVRDSVDMLTAGVWIASPTFNNIED